MAEPSAAAKLLAIYAADAGFTGGKLKLAVAVALAESGGNFDAGKGRTADRDNPRPGCGSYGAWQINSCPARDGDGPPRFGSAPETLLRPRINAAAAYVISGGGNNWRPWTTYRNGDYKAHLADAANAFAWLFTPAAKRQAEQLVGRTPLDMLSRKVDPTNLGAVFDAIAGNPLDVAGDLIDAYNPLDEVAAFLRLLGSWATWRRVLFVVVGLVLVAGAVALLVTDLKADLTGGGGRRRAPSTPPAPPAPPTSE